MDEISLHRSEGLTRPPTSANSPPMGDNYLVTGGAGFIGSHLVRRLLAEGHAVRVVDNLSTGRIGNIEEILSQVEFIEGDIAEPSVAERAVAGIRFILHQAALPSVPRSVADPVATDQSNVRGTLQLLSEAHKAGVQRVVQASSSSVYGNTPTLPKVETMPLSPRSPYAASKAACEMYGQAFYATHGLEYVALRYFNVFGPRQDPTSQYAAVLPRFICAYDKREPPTVFGDGKQSRDFCFIDNVVQANLLACQAKAAPGHVFNVGCHERTDLLSVLKMLADYFGYTIEARFDHERTGDVKHSLAAIDAARECLGYQPKVRFDQGLRQTADWFTRSSP